MKPQDLMVGDLISMGGVIRVVTGIHDKETENGVDLITTMIPGHTFPDSNLSFRASYCYPIPLTPEILEKNGWEEYEDSKDFHGQNCVFIKQNGGCYGVCIDSKRTVSGTFKYVHELQHALRLCGIKKEIVL